MRPAECLTGLELAGGWKVTEIVTPPPSSTGGKFSVGYRVTDSFGRSAYLKALDFSRAFQAPDPSRELQSMTEAYNFERDLLEKCKSRKLHRVVTPLADGVVKAPGNFGDLENVCYLIFEQASGDIRDEIGRLMAFDLAWCLRSLHNTAVGVRQLHGGGIAHQDLKPSNVLVFDEAGSKIADLGRASDSIRPCATDGFPIPGDVGYAPPEQFYAGGNPRTFSERCLADVYLFGSLFFFYFANCSATQALRSKLISFSIPGTLAISFENHLPYWRQAFQEVMIDLEQGVRPIAGDLTDDILLLVTHLCDPDPTRRGDQRSFDSIAPQYSLERAVSKLDLLARRAELQLV